MLSTRTNTLKLLALLGSLVCILICFGFDLSLVIATGDHTSPVSLRITSTNKISLSAINASQVSVKGKQMKLLIKELSGDQKQLAIRSENPRIFYKSLLIDLDSGQRSRLVEVLVQIGDRKLQFSKESFYARWRLTDRSGSRETFQLPTDLQLATSRLPKIKEVINWNGDTKLIKAMAIARLPVIISLLLLNYLFFFRKPPRTQGGSRKTTMYLVFFFVLFIAYRSPFHLETLHYGLDPSWITGLSWATLKGLSWGKSLIFTYGPYYWVLFPSVILPQSDLIKAFLLNTLVFVLSAGTIWLSVRNAVEKRQLPVSAAALILMIITFFRYELANMTLAAAVLLLSRPEEKKELSFSPKMLVAIPLLLLLALAKFGYAAAAIGILAIYTIAELLSRRYLNALLAPVITCLVFFLLWILADQRIEQIGPFFKYCIQIAGNYTEAMATPVWDETTSTLANTINLLMLVGAVLLLIGLGALLIITLPQRNFFWVVLMTTPVLFLFYKEAFVRSDVNHSIQFYTQLVLLLIVYIVSAATAGFLKKKLVAFLTVSFLLCLPVIYLHRSTVFGPVKWVIDEPARRHMVSEQKQAIRQFFGLPDSVINVIKKGGSVDILPWEIAVLYAYDLNWAPRPVLQSYTAYAADLDSLDAAYFARSDAPKHLLYAYSFIDGRYPIFDEPKLFSTLIHRYQSRFGVVGVDPVIHLPLEKKRHPQPWQPAFHSTVQARLNEPVTIPVLKRRHLFMHVTMKPTLLGRLATFFYKIPPSYIELSIKGESSPKRFRFIRPVAVNGLFVSHFAGDLRSTEKIFKEDYLPDIEKIKIIGNDWFYQDQLSFRFTTQPFR